MYKKIGNITYRLVYFRGDNTYAITKCNDEIMKNGQVHEIPLKEIPFHNKEDAMEYFKKLTEESINQF